MKNSFTSVAWALGASTTAAQRDTCTFIMTAMGGEFGQLGDGQNRVGGSYLAG